MYWMNRSLVQRADAVGRIGEEATIDYFAKAQYRNADRETAREALSYAIQVHNKMKGTTGKLYGRDGQIDLGYCYGELSLLEEAAGNSDLARDYMQHAVQTLKEVGLRGPITSEAHIRERLSKEPFVDAARTERHK
jgi:hypothetical protein